MRTHELQATASEDHPPFSQRWWHMLARHLNPLPAARVLLADADPDTRELYCTALTANRYEVDEAEDGREALAKVFGFRPALLIAATRLPFGPGNVTRRFSTSRTRLMTLSGPPRRPERRPGDSPRGR